MKILQINLNRSRLAQEHLEQKVAEDKIDIVVISEPWKIKKGWITDEDGNATIWAVTKNCSPGEGDGSGDGYAHAKLGKMRIFSVYWSPNIPAETCESKIRRLENTIRKFKKDEILVIGDLNAKSPAWGNRGLCPRGVKVMEMAESVGMAVVDTKGSFSFERNGRRSKIDVALANSKAYRRIIKSKILEDEETFSDHRYVLHQLEKEEEKNKGSTSIRGWKTEKVNKKSLAQKIGGEEIKNIKQKLKDQVNLKTVEEAMQKLYEICNQTMPKRKKYEGVKEAVYWWNEEIAELKRECISAKRAYTRSRRKGTEEWAALKNEYKARRREMKIMIIRAKERKWKELCDLLEADPWGAPYKIAMKMLKGRKLKLELNKERAREIMKELFQADFIDEHSEVEETQEEQQMHEGNTETEMEEVMEIFKEEEVRQAIKKIGSGKAPGEDGLQIETIKEMIENDAELFVNILNTCLMLRKFPRRWKAQYVILIPKPGKDPERANAYRPLSMINTMGKILEHLIKNRIEEELKKGGGYQGYQFGFRPGRSTVEAVDKVVEIAKIAQKQDKHCLFVTIDVKNAFNTVRPGDVIEALKRKKVAKYLIDWVEDYFKYRELIMEAKDGVVKAKVRAGVPQGSVMGPLCWNLVYDELLGLHTGKETTKIAYADDLALLVTAKGLKELQKRLERELGVVERWMEKRGLEIEWNKTEVMFLKKKRAVNMEKIKYKDKEFRLQEEIKYLGIYVDQKLSFKTHLQHTRDKAMKNLGALARILPNTSTASQTRRKLVLSTITSIVNYGIPVWWKATETEAHIKGIKEIQRHMAIRTVCAYRTVRREVAMLLAGLVPVEIEAKYKRELFCLKIKERSAQEKENKSSVLNEKRIKRIKKAKESFRKEIIQEWQRRWDKLDPKQWTRRLIGNVESWIDRKHGGCDYRLTQALTGHGVFATYLKRIQKEETADCWECGSENDDPEHAFFKCKRWRSEKEKLDTEIGSKVRVENIIPEMLKSKANWEKIAAFLRRVVESRENLENIREKTGMRTAKNRRRRNEENK